MAYATLDEVRALPGLDDEAAFPDALLEECIARAEELILDYCGPWEPTTITRRLDGGTGSVLSTGIGHIRSITSATFDATEQDVTEWEFDLAGDVYLPATATARIVSITVQAGIEDAAPERLKWAARTLAAAYVSDHESATPDRALAVQSEFGQIQLAQAGGRPDRPTSYPEVNAVLNRYRASFGGITG